MYTEGGVGPRGAQRLHLLALRHRGPARGLDPGARRARSSESDSEGAGQAGSLGLPGRLVLNCFVEDKGSRCGGL